MTIYVEGQPVQVIAVQRKKTEFVSGPIYLREGTNLIELRTLDHSKSEIDSNVVVYDLEVKYASLGTDHSLDTTLGNLRLTRADLPQTVKQGATMAVGLVWESEAPIEIDLKTFVHLVNGEGETVAQHDARPDDWRFPTSIWPDQALVRDIHPLAIPQDLPTGAYQVYCGVYDSAMMERLSVTATGDTVDAHGVLVAELEVVD